YDTAIDVNSATTSPTPTLVGGTLYTNSATGYTDTLSGGTFAYANPNASSGNKTLNVSGVSILNDSTSAANNYTVT
ncbi:hypothetical protein JZU68_04020, partial [bacterium]|nr:hypothetical protein [bacterium]